MWKLNSLMIRGRSREILTLQGPGARAPKIAGIFIGEIPQRSSAAPF